MLLIGYCYGIRFERRLCGEVELHLAYRWFCRLDLDDRVPDHSTFSVNRHGRFRDSDLLRRVFEAVVRACGEVLIRQELIAQVIKELSDEGSGGLSPRRTLFLDSSLRYP
jgi:transposase